MILALTPSHLDTISKLMEIAKKHNCSIRISVGEERFPLKDEAVGAIWQYMAEHQGLTEEITDEIMKYIDVEDAYYLGNNVCFELIEKDLTGDFKCHFMTYWVLEASLHYSVSSYNRNFHALPQEAEDWLCQYERGFGAGYIPINASGTIVDGFPGIDTHVNVYREGMAVKFFGDLVCDYLHEPRIEKVY